MPSLSIYRKDEGRLGRLAASLSFRSAPCLQAAVLLQAAHITLEFCYAVCYLPKVG